MSEVTQIMDQIQQGDPHASAQLLPLIYDELRRLAAGHMANEDPSHTLDATALVHEAYLRLVGPVREIRWDNRGHFFAAAAEAMRRILVESARRKQAQKRGGGHKREMLQLDRLPATNADADCWIDLDSALAQFEAIDADSASLAKLRVFGGLSVEEAAEALAMPRSSAFRVWSYARAWLTAAISDLREDL
jgi:RNA polymerase sigma factor (TIGR02999 family)